MTAPLINTDFIRKHPAEVVLTVLGLSGVALIFLPFWRSYVPVEELFRDLGWLPLLGPFVVLPFFISAGYLRWVLTGGLSRWETWLGYVLALIVVIPLSLSTILVWWRHGLDNGWLIFACLTLGLWAGVWFVIHNLRRGAPAGQTALVALQLAYLPFAIGWLTALAVDDLIKGRVPDVHIGAYLAFLTVLIYTTQAALLVRGQPHLLIRLLPLGLIWVPWVVAVAVA